MQYVSTVKKAGGFDEYSHIAALVPVHNNENHKKRLVSKTHRMCIAYPNNFSILNSFTDSMEYANQVHIILYPFKASVWRKGL